MSAPSVNETFGASRQPLLPPPPGTPLPPTRHPMFPPTQSFSRRSDGDQTVCQIGFTYPGLGERHRLLQLPKLMPPPRLSVRITFVCAPSACPHDPARSFRPACPLRAPTPTVGLLDKNSCERRASVLWLKNSLSERLACAPIIPMRNHASCPPASCPL